MHIKTIETPLGPMLALAEEKALLGLWFYDQKYFPELFGVREKADLEIFGQLENWLKLYFQGNSKKTDFRLKPQGTEFQKTVWQELLKIKPGAVTSYGRLAQVVAEKSGRPSMSAQAVGGAVGHNPISIIIPCHRVLGSQGQLTGYAGGLDRKRHLLRLEKASWTEKA